MILKPAASMTVNVLVGDDLALAGARGLKPRPTLELEAAALTSSGELTISLNGLPLSNGRVSNHTVTFALDPMLVRLGSNRVAITSGTGTASEMTLRDLRLWIRY